MCKNLLFYHSLILVLYIFLCTSVPTSEGDQMEVPNLFRCPISLDVFTDPVTLCTGQTYDRRSIETWLQAGNMTCPVTGQNLHDTTLVPNHNLRHLVEQWRLANPNVNKLVKPSGVGSCLSSDTDMEMSLVIIKSILESESVTENSKIEMLRKVRNLLIESDANQACMIQLGFFPLLVELSLKLPVDVSLSYPELLETSLDCVLMLLPSSDLDCLNTILANDLKLHSLVRLLNEGSAKIRTTLCCLLETVSLSEKTRELAVFLSQSPFVMQSLTLILHNNTDEPVTDACVGAIHGLCSLDANRQNALGEGIIHELINYLSRNSTEKSDSTKALMVLELLLESESDEDNIPKIENLIEVLVKHIFEVASGNRGSEYATSMLLTMCCDSESALDESITAGMVTQLVLLIQSQCTETAKIRATELLKLSRLKCRI